MGSRESFFSSVSVDRRSRRDVYDWQMRLLDQTFKTGHHRAALRGPHPYREQILRSLLQILLCDTALLCQAQHVVATASRTRSQLIAAAFKQLVNAHHASERSLAFYAGHLCITPKHLAETVKAATGKRAVAWLAEAVLLEAQVLLQNPALPIGQIAEALHFADQSTFGRFFCRHTGLTPASYRQRRS